MQASKSTLEARMKGLEKIKVIVLEEATDITNYDSVLKLMDTVARTKVLQKNGINMDAVTWTPIEPARTKEQFLSGADVTGAPEVAKQEAVA